jgi:hypothetical protein
MTLLTVVKDVCATVGVQVPSTVFGGIANNRTMQEMLALANEMAQRIAYDTRDWTELSAYVALDGAQGEPPSPFGTTAFVLPANYKRMLLTSNVWRSTSSQQPMMFVPNYDEWLQRRLSNTNDARGEWIITGGRIWTYPVVSSGTKVAFIYMDKNCVVLTGGGFGDSFMNDADRFRLDERLLKLGMIWQWKAQKGSPYAEDMGSYSDALANAMGHDQPAPILIDRRPMSHHNRGVAYPWPVPT